MAKKPTNPVRKNIGRNSNSKPASRDTQVRNSAIPRMNVKPTRVSTAPRSISHEQIAQRAYFISCSPNCGTPDENWLRAERELRAELAKNSFGGPRPVR